MTDVVSAAVVPNLSFGSSQSIGVSVPAGATHVLVALRCANNGTGSYTGCSMSCCSNGFTELGRADGGGSPHAKFILAIGELTDDGAGHTITASFNQTAGDGNRYTAALVFLDGEGVVARDVGITRDSGGGSGSPVSIDTDYGDLVLGFSTSWSSTPPDNVSGFSRLAASSTGNNRISIYSLDSVDDGGATLPNWGSASYAGSMLVGLYDEGDGPRITDPTPTGVLLTRHTAQLGCSTDTEEGTLYWVVDTVANLASVTGPQVAAGHNNADSSAAYSGDVEVTDDSPGDEAAGLLAGVTYAYALVQQDEEEGLSNVLTGTFTTAEISFTTTLEFVGEEGHFIRLDGSPQANLSGITFHVWRSSPPAQAAPDQIITGQSLDAAGELSLEILRGDLEDEDPVTVVAFTSDGLRFYAGAVEASVVEDD